MLLRHAWSDRLAGYWVGGTAVVLARALAITSSCVDKPWKTARRSTTGLSDSNCSPFTTGLVAEKLTISPIVPSGRFRQPTDRRLTCCSLFGGASIALRPSSSGCQYTHL